MTATTRRDFLAVGTGLAVGLSAGRASEQAIAPKPNIPFTLGMVTYNIGAKLDIPSLLRVCKATGIGPVELRTTHKHGVEPTLSPVQRKEVKKQFADAGVVIWGSGSVCEFHSPNPKVVEENIETCKKFLDLVKDLGAKGVKVRPNGLPKDVPVSKTIEQIGKALQKCGQAASDAGVEIWVEVHGGGTAKPETMKAIMEQCGHSSVGVTWNSNPDDVVNGSVAKSFELLKPWIKSCHINDLFKDGQGVYPYRELFSLLTKSGYNRTTLIEVGKTMPDEPSTIEFLRYYKALWLELAKPVAGE
ncbi:MAG: sugar phosphate isomerase/epimerase [Gemmataceae bacterium]|nr:sugar phosphate isomerase/epimerase [Gemmataceae bacterium]